MKIVPDSSVLIPYFTRSAYTIRIERLLRLGQLVVCSVVAEELLAGARDELELRRYARLFGEAARLGMVITPDDAAWRLCGRMLSRYRERYGRIAVRDHQNDVLILLSARQLASSEETVVLTENARHFTSWFSLLGDREGLRIENARRDVERA